MERVSTPAARPNPSPAGGAAWPPSLLRPTAGTGALVTWPPPRGTDRHIAGRLLLVEVRTQALRSTVTTSSGGRGTTTRSPPGPSA